MATAKTTSRPLSPHLGIWKWGPHMLVSILHRATGDGMALVGLGLMTWWLAALAGGADSYASFVDLFTLKSGGLNIVGYVVGVGLTLSFFQHVGSGLRHFVLDLGAGYELKGNRRMSIGTMVFSVVATLAFWAWLSVGK